MEKDIFKSAYITAIYFTETGDIDQPSTNAELSESSYCEALNDCSAFWEAYGKLIGNVRAEQAGHDFWLTRNGHGSGFWDRPELYGKKLADELTRASIACGGRWVTFEDKGV